MVQSAKRSAVIWFTTCNSFLNKTVSEGLEICPVNKSQPIACLNTVKTGYNTYGQNIGYGHDTLFPTDYNLFCILISRSFSQGITQCVQALIPNNTHYYGKKATFL
ncbi:hypothetical protein GDO86_007922 [Hymenochirus boettgeri]|uniref:Uncharacterized protein n=1 Tax=Hymenochirus boettgeri TaxID=247094 RepID=A0A8T2J124_9PIPI|nr:hypothetical protein GDO86_007922 [Hymenochirus boettgeri]